MSGITSFHDRMPQLCSEPNVILHTNYLMLPFLLSLSDKTLTFLLILQSTLKKTVNDGHRSEDITEVPDLAECFSSLAGR